MGTNVELVNENILKIIVESWKFEKSFLKAIEQLPLSGQKKFMGRYNWYDKCLKDNMEAMGISIRDSIGIPYDIGMIESPINLDEFNEDDKLVVEQVIEPTIIDKDGRILKAGTVMLRRIG